MTDCPTAPASQATPIVVADLPLSGSLDLDVREYLERLPHRDLPAEKNKAEGDQELGSLRLRVLSMFALARLGEGFDFPGPDGRPIHRWSRIPVRPYLKLLTSRLGCGSDFVFELVDRLCAKGPQNTKVSEMLKQAQGGGKGTSRLPPSATLALDAAIRAACVEQGLRPGTQKTNKVIRELIKANAPLVEIPATKTIRKRSMSPEVQAMRAGAYERDHLFRLVGSPELVTGLNSVVQLDTTQFTNEEYELLVVDRQGRNMGPANVIFGVLASCRGIWTYLPFAGAANSFLSGLAIKRGLLAKDALLDSLGVKGILPFHGKVGEIKHDNGPEFANDHLQEVCLARDFAIRDLRPPQTPQYGSMEERFNRSAQRLFREFLDSPQGKRYLRPVASKPGAYGILLEDLDRALAEWICEYHKRGHAGLGGDSPLSRFEKFAKGEAGLPASGIPGPLAETPDLIWDFLWRETRTVNHLGIAFANRRYGCAKLSRFFRVNSRSSGRRVEFRFNPYAMRSVFIRFPDDDISIPPCEVPWIREADKYRMTPEEAHAASNPSLWEWEVLFKVLRAAGVANPTGGVVEALHARNEARSAEQGTPGAPSRKTKVQNDRARGMREHLGTTNLPLACLQGDEDEEAISENHDSKPDVQLPKPRSASQPPQAVMYAVGDGADAY